MLFKPILKTALAALLSTEVFSAGVYDWKQNGADWGLTYPLCATGQNQSPIDLNDSVVKTSDRLEVKGSNYPNFVTQALSRGGATSVTNITNAKFEAQFDDGRDGTFFPL
jgi:carbonic anhydrase